MWVLSAIVECNRTPFDFAEGESELVSGYNTEFGAIPFVLLFLAEYSRMLLMSYFSCVLLLGVGLPIATLPCLALVYLFVWVRRALPRTRYDKLMLLC